MSANGDRYEGEWTDDEKNGKGRQTFASGGGGGGRGEEPEKVAATGGENEWYDGQWKAGAFHGQGEPSSY